MNYAQFEALPEILQDVINCDRVLTVIRRDLAEPVVPFAIADRFRRQRRLRRDLSRGAAAIWGPGIGSKDGSARC